MPKYQARRKRRVSNPYAPYKKRSPSFKKNRVTAVKRKRRYNNRSNLTATKKLTKQVKKLKKIVSATDGTHTWKKIDSGMLLCQQNVAAMQQLTILGKTVLEDFVGDLRYFNPSNPGTLLQADTAAGIYSRKLFINGVSAKIVFRNNYRVPVNLTVYTLKVKQDTGTGPISAFQQGLADQNLTLADAGKIVMFPTDSNMFNSLWSIEKRTAKHLEAGAQHTHYLNVKPFEWDPSIDDTQTQAYTKMHRTRMILIRLHGVPAHDEVNALHQGLNDGSVDWILNAKYQIIYDAGTNLTDFTVSDTLSTMAAGALVGARNNSNHERSLT